MKREEIETALVTYKIGKITLLELMIYLKNALLIVKG